MLKTLAVPGDFNCRHLAVSRSYLYQFAIESGHGDGVSERLRKLLVHSPPTEKNLFDHQRISSVPRALRRRVIEARKLNHVILPVGCADNVVLFR